MNKLNIGFSFLVLILSNAEGMPNEPNISYINQTISWVGAASYCVSHSGVLESNITKIKQLYGDMNNSISSVWIGKFEILTAWAYIFGCFRISKPWTRYQLYYEEDHYECQQLCEDAIYFTVQDTNCFCIKDSPLPLRKCKCNGDGCLTIWKHYRGHIEEDTNGNQNAFCLEATDCRNEMFVISPRTCSVHNNVTCDDGRYFGKDFAMWQTASDNCYTQGSFIKWYEGICNLHILPNPHWTSGRRERHIFNHRRKYNLSSLNPERCHSFNQQAGVQTGSCYSTTKPFFCKFNEPIIETGNPDRTEQSDAGIAAGVVSLLVVIVAVILVTYFAYRRRLLSKPETKMKTDTPCNNIISNPSYSVENNFDSSSRIDHNYSTPIQGAREDKEYIATYDHTEYNVEFVDAYNISSPKKHIHAEYSEITIGLGHNGSLSRSEKSINPASEETNNYCFAKPIHDDMDPYTSNKDYDHLHNVKKKENPNHKVYDHLPASKESDPTYDRTNLKPSTASDGDYDHFSA